MAASKPIDINSLDEDTLAVARAAAESAGMTLEDWLARTLGDTPRAGTAEAHATEAPAADTSEVPHPEATAPSPAPEPTVPETPAPDPDATIIGTPPPIPSSETATPSWPDPTPPPPSPPYREQSYIHADQPGDLRSAVQALAASLATSTTDPGWAVRIDRIRRAVPASVSSTVASEPAYPEPKPTPRPAPPPLPMQEKAETRAGEPTLEPPQDVPPAPIIESEPTEPARQSGNDVFTDSELEKAIAAAQERRRQAGATGTAARRQRASGGWFVRFLLGLLILIAVAIIAVLAYAWITPSTSVDEVIDDLTNRASALFSDIEGQVDDIMGDDAADDDPVAPGLDDAAPPLQDDTSEGPIDSDGGATRTASVEDDAAAVSDSQAPQPDGTTQVLQPPPPDTTGPDTAPPDGTTPDGTTTDSTASNLPPDIAALQSRAEAGDPVAQRELGLRYLNGDGIRQDPEAAYLWLEEAAVSSDPEAQYLLGTMLESGNGTEADPLIAMAWYMSAAEAGKPEANLRLGEIYRDGDLWPQSYADAAERFRAAADAGSAEAEFELAQLYGTGNGVDHSPLLAHAWYSRAAEHGIADAEARMSAIAATLTPEQLAQSETLAANPPPTDTTLYGAPAAETTDAITGTPDTAADTATVEPAEASETPTAADDTTAEPAVEPVIENPGVTGSGLTTAVGPDGTVTIDAAGDAATDDTGTDDSLPVSQISPAAIQEIQTLLNALGYESGRPDGIPGRRTEQAIRDYQAAQGLPVTGEPSLSLLARLRSQGG